MFTLRCTQKLLRRIKPTPGYSTGPSTTVLGDWYANLLIVRPKQLVLCVSERTLLPVVLPAKEFSTIGHRLPEALGAVLTKLGISPDLVEKEMAEMRTLAYGSTQNRRVLGSLNEFMLELQWHLHEHPEENLIDAALRLAGTPCKPIGGQSPEKLTVELFGIGRSV